MRSGESLIDALHALESLGADAILLNCSNPEAINACWPQLSRIEQKIGAYANGLVSVAPLQPGDTVKQLEARQDLKPQQYAECAMVWARNGALVIGGCREIGPDHIKVLYEHLCSEALI